MDIYTINGFIDLLEKQMLSLKDILDIRTSLKRPFKKHPLGFYSCTLLEEDSYKIRLHYWDKLINEDMQSSELTIHDHIFNFKSWVMLGSIENIQYQEDDNGQIYNVYSGVYQENYSILKKTSKVLKIKKQSTNIFKNGESYTMSAGVLHETKLLDNLTFTVLYTEDTNLKNPLVLGSTSLENTQYIYERSEINEVEIKNLLSKIVMIP